jgi:hypothetical protein
MKEILKDKFGLGLDIKESPKTEAEREESIFIDTIETIEHIWHAEHELHGDYGIDLLGFSQYYYHIIENLIIAKYGYDTAEVIWWWVLDRFSEDGELLGVEMEDGKVYMLETPLDLWKFLQKL